MDKTQSHEDALIAIISAISKDTEDAQLKHGCNLLIDYTRTLGMDGVRRLVKNNRGVLTGKRKGPLRDD